MPCILTIHCVLLRVGSVQKWLQPLQMLLQLSARATCPIIHCHQTTTDLDRAVRTSGVEASLVDVLRQTRDLSIVVNLRERLDFLTRVNHPDDERTTHAHRHHLQPIEA